MPESRFVVENPGAPRERRPSFIEPGDSRTGLRRARRAALIWGLFLMALSSWPSPPEVPVVSAIPNVDKLVHGLLYGVEGFLLYFAVAWPGPPRFSLLRALTIGGALAVWGTLDEIHQAWIPGRAVEAADALVDTLGGFLGAVAGSAASVRWRATARPSPRP